MKTLDKDIRPSANRWLAARAREVIGPLAAAVGAGTADGLLVIAQAALIGWIVHTTILGSQLGDLLLPLAALLAVFIGRAACTWSLGAAGTEAAAGVVAGVREALYRQLVALGPARLARQHSGAVASTMVEQVEALEGYYARFLPQTVIAVIVPLAIVIAVGLIDWLAGLLLLFAAPLAPLFMALIGMGAERLARRQQRTMARVSAYYLDRLRGILTLRLFRAGARATEEVEHAADMYRRRSLRVLRVAFLSSTVMDLIATISIAVVAVYVGLSLLGYLTFGPGQSLTLFSGLFVLLLAPEVFVPLRRLALHYHDRANAVGAAEEIIDLLMLPAPAFTPAVATPVPVERDERELPLPVPVGVEYRGVAFAYDGGTKPVLQNVTLAVAPGERVAIAGASGSGKSTLLHLAAGFLQPTGGEVLIDGKVPADEGAVAWVGQRPWLFYGTLADNIRLADPGATDAQVRAAAEAADLGPLLDSLPDGLNTLLGERGYGLSGGQARRLALARALLSGAPVLLLDEPTEGLDRASAERVLAALSRLADGRRTIIVATHDPAVQAWADRTVHLSAGSLAEAVA